MPVVGVVDVVYVHSSALRQTSLFCACVEFGFPEFNILCADNKKTTPTSECLFRYFCCRDDEKWVRTRRKKISLHTKQNATCSSMPFHSRLFYAQKQQQQIPTQKIWNDTLSELEVAEEGERKKRTKSLSRKYRPLLLPNIYIHIFYGKTIAFK